MILAKFQGYRSRCSKVMDKLVISLNWALLGPKKLSYCDGITIHDTRDGPIWMMTPKLTFSERSYVFV